MLYSYLQTEIVCLYCCGKIYTRNNLTFCWKKWSIFGGSLIGSIECWALCNLYWPFLYLYWCGADWYGGHWSFLWWRQVCGTFTWVISSYPLWLGPGCNIGVHTLLWGCSVQILLLKELWWWRWEVLKVISRSVGSTIRSVVTTTINVRTGKTCSNLEI